MREHADLPGDLARGQIAGRSPILPVRQNAQSIAQPTCVEMQNVCAGVSGNVDGLDVAAVVSRSRNLVVPSVDVWRDSSSGVVDGERAGQSACADRARRSVICAKSVTPRR